MTMNNSLAFLPYYLSPITKSLCNETQLEQYERFMKKQLQVNTGMF